MSTDNPVAAEAAKERRGSQSIEPLRLVVRTLAGARGPASTSLHRGAKGDVGVANFFSRETNRLNHPAIVGHWRPGRKNLSLWFRSTVIRASRGKAIRAEPVGNLYEQGRVHHVGEASWHEELEEQLTTFPIAHEADDRLDAVVWAIVHMSGNAKSTLSLDDSLPNDAGSRPILGGLRTMKF